MALTAEQRKVLSAIKRGARRNNASPKEVKAAIQTGIVESGLRNLSGGDRDSAGWRQERASLYRDPTNLDASVDRFFQETGAVKGKYGSAGQLAAAVQRPAAQYRGRYAQVSEQADKLMGRMGGPTIPGVSPAPAQTAQMSGPSVLDQRRQLLGQYLAVRGQPGALAGLGSGLANVKAPQRVAPEQKVAVGEQLGNAAISEFMQRAQTIDRKRLPYLWGGGHGGKVDPKSTGPLDCSGAVSAVLGINPRVSGQFMKWGKPGAGDGKGVVVYADHKHVLMSIGGKFFGTSESNPGGGAGWIPRSQVSKSYLKRYTVRHL
ncbi:MAG TPA: hypothetical protein VE645_19160 [Pseudonocardiaceae bacterium]|nr:hypothetical protein [Pseudonocardiaceae bacterium]